jgi:hypothetical protein
MLTEIREYLQLGAKYELCGERESASKIYLDCVKEIGRMSDGTDALEFLYGQKIYERSINSYAQALEYVFIAECSRKVMETIRHKFPTVGCFQTPADGEKTDMDLLGFFSWLTTPRTINPKPDYEILKRAKSALDKSSKIMVEVSSPIARRYLEEVVFDLVNGNTKVVERRLR